jgi:DNA-binding protein Fis
MGSNSEKLHQLRPVTFHLKSDPQGVVQYGLIAEEVAKVYPELVIRDENGRIDGVRYDELAPMLLNEVQHQQSKIAMQSEKMRAMQERLTALEGLNRATLATLRKLQARGEFVVQR